MEHLIIKTKTLKRTGTSLNIIINEFIFPNGSATRLHICRGGVHMKNSSADYHPLEWSNCLQLNVLIEPQQSFGYFHKIIVLMNITTPAGYKNHRQDPLSPILCTSGPPQFRRFKNGPTHARTHAHRQRFFCL